MPPLGGDDDNNDILDILEDPTLDSAGDDTGADESNNLGNQSQQPNQQQTSVRDADFEAQRRQMQGRGQQQPIDPNKQNQQQRNQPQQAPNNQQQQQPVDPRSLRPFGKTGLFTDKNMNIVDGAGHIVAHAGLERRLWQDNQRLREETQRLTGHLKSVLDDAKTRSEVNDLPRQYGVSPDEVREGMTIVKMFKENPVAAAKDVVARAVALGYTVQQILDPKLPGGDLGTAAIQKILDDRLGPLQQKSQEEQRRAELESRAREEYDRFIRSHPYSDVHQDIIANLMRRSQVEGGSLSPEEAYMQLREFAARNNFDFSMDLQPQIEERQRQIAQQRQVQQNGQQPQTRSQQNGQRRSSPVPGNAPVQQQLQTRPEVYSDDDDWKSIIRREASGLTN